MIKYTLSLCLAFAASVATAEWTEDSSADQAWFQTLPMEDEAQVELEDAQWGYRRRPWTCWARNRRGMTFWGESWSREGARRIAMNRCASRSSACAFAGCR